MKKVPLIILVIFTTLQSAAQSVLYEYNELTTGQVIENGQLLTSPFCGGINSTQLNHADINNDGKKDLTLFDQNTKILQTYINVGTNGQMLYQYQPKYIRHFPPLATYLKLIDYNCDSIPDLIHRGGTGFTIFRGQYNIQNELTFSYYKELWYPPGIENINAYVAANDIPIVADLDCDGDLDFASFGVFASLCHSYKNLQVENNLPCDSIVIDIDAQCHGSMYQTAFRTHVLKANCKGGWSNKGSRHGSNCILALDIEGNGTQDMIIGNTSFSEAQILYDSLACPNTYFTSQDTLFKLDGHQLDLRAPAPFYCDIDNDNDLDLIFTTHLDNSSSPNYNAISLYKNNGTTANPNFNWTNDSVLSDQMIDVGRNSYPTLFDFDKDGKKDLFIGGEGYFNTNSKTTESLISYYRNTSTLGVISFELVTKDFLNLSLLNYDGLYPTFGDITGDGVDDLVIGHDIGTISVYKNNATSNTAPPNFVLITNQYKNIDVGNYSFPLIHDMNGDSKTDLLIGCEIGTLWLYEDTSTTTIKEMKLIDSAVGDVRVRQNHVTFGYSAPFIGHIDSSSKEYLLIGTSDGFVALYDSFFNQYTNWLQLDTNFAMLQSDSMYDMFAPPRNFKNAPRTVPVFDDLDGDLRPELILGSQHGGVRLFQFNKKIITRAPRDKGLVNNIPIKIFPNPNKERLWIQTAADISSIQSYSIRNITGKLVRQSDKNMDISNSISTKNLSSGIYFIEIIFNDRTKAIGKFVKEN